MARIMLCENSIPKHFWVEVVNIASYLLKERGKHKKGWLDCVSKIFTPFRKYRPN